MATIWTKGTDGRVFTNHPSDGNYSARARLTHDSPPNQEIVTLLLLERFYDLDYGDLINMRRTLFRPDPPREE